MNIETIVNSWITFMLLFIIALALIANIGTSKKR